MAVRKLNYTGRKKLRQSDVRITLYESKGVARFDADLALAGYGLPESASVFVEAYRQTSWMRFRFGTVRRVRAQDEPEICEFDTPEGVLFRVRITANGDPKGMLLAEADKIRPRRAGWLEDENRLPLLPVRPDEDLAEEVFRLDFSDRPVLLVNARLGDWRSAARSPVFVSMAYPSAMREVLTRILYVEGYHDTDDAEDWRCQWLLFAAMLPGVDDSPAEGEKERFDDWIDDAVSAMCRRLRAMERFDGYLTGESGA